MDFSSVCRTCLGSNSLNPIFKNETDHERYSSAVYIATGVQVQINDTLPQNMCTPCINLINHILKFRKQCRDAHTELLEIKIKSAAVINVGKIEKNCSDTLHKVVQGRKQHTKVKDHLTEQTIKVEYSIVTLKEECLDIEEDVPLQSINASEDSDHQLKNEKSCIKYVPEYLETDIDDESNMKEIDTDDNLDDRELTANSPCEIISDTLSKQYPNIANGETLNTAKHEELYFKDISGQNINDKIKNATVQEIRTDQVKKVSSDHIMLKTHPRKIDKKDDFTDLPYNIMYGSENSNRVTCKMCQKELSIRSVDYHMARRHPGADERKKKCELCDSYMLREKLKRHMLLTHGGAFRCGYCKTEFDSKELLLQHGETCTAKKKKRKVYESGREMVECDVCLKSMQRASLGNHKAVAHAGLRPICEHCGRSFGNKHRLGEHYRAKHGYDKFKCAHCPFTSAALLALKNHERRHRGEKPFVCAACGARFHATYLLAQHAHSHRPHKTHKCDKCPAIFKSNNSLHVHKMSCHSAAQYRCGLCGRTYRSRPYVAKHLRHVHDYTGDAPDIQRVPCDTTPPDAEQ